MIDRKNVDAFDFCVDGNAADIGSAKSVPALRFFEFSHIASSSPDFQAPLPPNRAEGHRVSTDPSER